MLMSGKQNFFSFYFEASRDLKVEEHLLVTFFFFFGY